MAAVYLVMVQRNARRHGVSLLPDWHGIRALSRVGSWLMLRTLSLRIGILATVLVVTGQGAVNLAAHQLAMTMFTFFAFALDALAIAAQALIGKELGASNPEKARLLTRTMIRWGTGFGVVTGVLLAVAAPFTGALFTSDAGVQSVLTLALWVLAAGQPIAGYVFVLDGVLIGAGDAKYLALAGLANLAVYLPLLIAVPLAGAAGADALVWVWVAFSLGYMLARAVTLGLRARTDRWMVLGS
jgi:Na+-driven multidrug efflux pump